MGGREREREKVEGNKISNTLQNKLERWNIMPKFLQQEWNIKKLKEFYKKGKWFYGFLN